MVDWNAPTGIQRWMARHSRVIVPACLAVVVVMIVSGAMTWVEDGWRSGIGPILSTVGFLSFAYAARQCKRLVDEYDSRRDE